MDDDDDALPAGDPRTAAQGEDVGGGGVERVTLPPRCELPEAGDVLTLAAAELEGDVVDPVAMIGVVAVALVVVVLAISDGYCCWSAVALSMVTVEDVMETSGKGIAGRVDSPACCC